jgi:hypothetical protein
MLKPIPAAASASEHESSAPCHQVAAAKTSNPYDAPNQRRSTAVFTNIRGLSRGESPLCSKYS